MINCTTFKTYIINKLKITCFLLGLVLLSGCNSDRENAFLELTTLEIEDPVRHYYPIVRGLELNIVVKVTNTGNHALKIYNVLPSCGCTLAEYRKRAIAPGDSGFIQLKYDSTKNVGKVGVYTTIVANTKQHSHTVYFDLNVVPDALYTKDYEELYQIKKDEEGLVQELIEGKTNQRGYIVDSTEVQKYK